MNAAAPISNPLGFDPRGSGRERVLFLLKIKGPQTAARMSSELGVTAMAVRQHLAVLDAEKFVEFTTLRREAGRPARVWQLTPQANERFSDGHAELAVGMLQAIQGTFGEQGLDRLTQEWMTQEWTRQQADSYAMQASATITKHSTMQEVLNAYSSAQRPLFGRYHIGGFNSCGYEPGDLLDKVANHFRQSSLEAASYFSDQGFGSEVCNVRSIG